MNTTRSARMAALAAALLIVQSARAAEPGLAVVSFGDYLWMRVDGRAVALEPGSAAYEVPLGARAVVAQGAATLLARDALLRADAGDDFSVTAADGQMRLMVNAGAVEVSVPGRPPVLVPAGRFAALTGPEAGVLPGTAPAPVAVRPPPPQPPAAALPPEPVRVVAPDAEPAAPKAEWDPLNAMASGLNRLSRFSKPELRLVLELHPFYRFTETYDTNIYMVPKPRSGRAAVGGGVVSSWIMVNELGTNWKLPVSKATALRGVASARATNYSQQPKTNNAVDVTVGGGLDSNLRRGVNASLWDTYVNTEDPAFSEQVARQRRMSNEVGGSLDVEHSRRLFTRLNARHTLSKYLDPSLAAKLNRYETSMGADFGVRLAPKTRAYLAYARELTHYSAGRADNSVGHRVGLGVDGILTARLTGRVQVDGHSRRYTAGTTGRKSTINNALINANLKFQATRRLVGRLGLWRSLNEATFGTNRYYTANGVSLGATQSFQKWSLGADGTFETSRYPEATTLRAVQHGNRRDDIYTGTLRVDYRLRTWLTTDLSYQRLQRFSNFPDEFNYGADRTSLSLRIQF